MIGVEYEDCNPFTPFWDNRELIPQTVQQQRKPRHVKKILDQWYNCAVHSKNETVQSFYKQLLVRVAAEGGRHLWASMAYDIVIDPMLKEFPKVICTKQEA